MEIAKKTIQFLLMIIFSIAVILLIIINITNSTVLSKEYVLAKLEEENYYAGIREEITSKFENYIMQSGLDETVLENVVTEEKIKADTGIIIENIYDGTETEISTDEIKENIQTNINNTLETALNVTQQRTVDQYIEKITDQYLDTMSHTSYEKRINEILVKVQDYVNLVQRGLMITVAISALLIIISNYKEIVKSISQIGTSLLSAGGFCVFLNIFVNIKIKIDNILILNEPISVVLRNIANEILNSIRSNGLIWAGIGILAIIIGCTLNEYIKNVTKMKRNGNENVN